MNRFHARRVAPASFAGFGARVLSVSQAWNAGMVVSVTASGPIWLMEQKRANRTTPARSRDPRGRSKISQATTRPSSSASITSSRRRIKRKAERSVRRDASLRPNDAAVSTRNSARSVAAVSITRSAGSPWARTTVFTAEIRPACRAGLRSFHERTWTMACAAVRSELVCEAIWLAPSACVMLKAPKRWIRTTANNS